MMALLKLIPTSVWVGLAAAIALAGAIWWVDDNGFDRGAAGVQVKWDADRLALQAAVAKEKARQAEVVTKEVIVYRDRVKVIKEVGDAIIKEIPVLVPMDGPLLAGGFRVFHDAVATGVLPDDPRGAADAAAPVALATVADTVGRNYQECRETSARLVALQNILKGASP